MSGHKKLQKILVWYIKDLCIEKGGVQVFYSQLAWNWQYYLKYMSLSCGEARPCTFVQYSFWTVIFAHQLSVLAEQSES